MKNLMSLGLIAGSLVIYSCGNNQEKKDEPSEPMQNEMRQEEETQGRDHKNHDQQKGRYEGEELKAEFKNEETAERFKVYIAIKDALVNSDVEAAGKKAEELAKAEEQSIVSAAGKIAKAEDINLQRKAFSELTAAMEALLEDALSSGAIYKQFCPMAFEGKGDYWFSNSKKVYNPYYGERMLKCGRVEATIQ